MDVQSDMPVVVLEAQCVAMRREEDVIVGVLTRNVAARMIQRQSTDAYPMDMWNDKDTSYIDQLARQGK